MSSLMARGEATWDNRVRFNKIATLNFDILAKISKKTKSRLQILTFWRKYLKYSVRASTQILSLPQQEVGSLQTNIAVELQNIIKYNTNTVISEIQIQMKIQIFDKYKCQTSDTTTIQQKVRSTQNTFTLFIDNNLVQTKLLTSKKKYKLPLPESFLARSKMTQLNLISKPVESPQGTTSSM